MSLKRKWLLFGVTTAAGLAACAPNVVKAYNDWKAERRKALVARTEAALKQGLDYIPWMDDLQMNPEEEGEEEGTAEAEAAERDYADVRRLAMQAEVGPRSPEFYQQLMLTAAAERQKWSALAAQPGDVLAASPSSPGTRPWTNLGPGSARSSYNGTYYKSVDSGRPTAIKVKPSDPKTVYLATAGGGVWKTSDFGQYPTWTPITDTLGTLATGALELDPNNESVLWLGLGDAYDQQGGGLVKSTDEGATWSAPILLSAAAHPVDGKSSITNNVRAIKVDPLNSNNILVATDDGIYRSTDGATFTLMDLPNTAATGPVREATWSIVYLGASGGQSQWLVSGQYACPNSLPPNPASGTQNRALGTAACPTNAAVGNYGDIWKSTDSGATWVSLRASGALPASVTSSTANDLGQVQLAASGTANPAATVVYALGGSLNDSASATNAVLKSVNGGSTWTQLVNKNTPVTNPTVLATDCTTLNVGHDQSWYNLAIAVDPLDANRVLIGGNLCGIRSRDGGATWQNMAHWLPQGGGGYTAEGFLPYVHADWHTATIFHSGSTFMAMAGTDGGLFLSYDVFDRDSGATVNWLFPDVGLVTQLPYSIGSGDPTLGNASVAFSGLQDNGTRFRLIDDENFIFDINTQNWDQISGGDGIGTAVANDPRGRNPVYWISVQSQHKYCRPRAHDCSRATRIENGSEISNWTRVAPSLPSGDSLPFSIRYSPLNDEASTVLAISTQNLYRITVDPVSDRAAYTRITPSGIVVAGATRSTRGLGVTASPHTYTINGQPARVYGLPLSSGASAVLVDFGASVSLSGGATGLNAGGVQLLFTQSVSLPKDPAVLGGTDIRKTWLVSTVAAATATGAPVPDSVGHLFKTTDGGATWVPFHGNGTGFDLPNIPVWAVRFDPTDDNIIYAGTELGLYRSTDAGNTWARYGQGLPMVRVYDLTIATNGSLLRVATYGRGIWEIYPRSEATPTPETGDWDGNGVIDYFDMSAMAGRLGTTPATSTNLRYDSKLDLTGSPTTIEEADLSSLTGKFGGTP